MNDRERTIAASNAYGHFAGGLIFGTVLSQVTTWHQLAVTASIFSAVCLALAAFMKHEYRRGGRDG